MNKVILLEQECRRILKDHVAKDFWAYGFTFKEIFIGVIVRRKAKVGLSETNQTNNI